jgi:hypothetical protein
MASRITTSSAASVPREKLHAHRAHRRGRTALLCVLMATSVAAAAQGDASRATLRQATKRGPALAGKPTRNVLAQLQKGYRSALRRVYHVERCQELFSRLGADGLEVLQGTTYVVASSEWEKTICEDAEAFTTVNGSQVTLCGGFGWISDRDAAIVLLHEALHNAGLTEQPSDPDGPTPEQIDRMVEVHCGF